MDIKRKIVASALSMGISILVVPIFSITEGYFSMLVWFGLYMTPLMLLIGVPVSFLATYLLKRKPRFLIVWNALIHLLPAVVVGYLLFPLTPFMFLIVLVASIFFAVDTLYYYQLTTLRYKTAVLLVIALTSFLVFLPTLVQTVESFYINRVGPPQVELRVNGKEVAGGSSSCWSSEEDGCGVGNQDPFLLPIDPVANNELQVGDEVEVEARLIDFEEDDYYIEIYYYQDDEIQSMRFEEEVFLLPKGLKEQMVKLSIVTDNGWKLYQSFGLRNGNR